MMSMKYMQLRYNTITFMCHYMNDIAWLLRNESGLKMMCLWECWCNHPS